MNLRVPVIDIHTPRLLLRRFTMDDAPAMYRNWASDPEVVRFLTWPVHADVETSREVLANWIAAYETGDFPCWGIELSSLGEVIGSISIVRRDDSVAAVEVGYCIGSRWWHQGIMTEALGGLIDHIFANSSINRIGAVHDTRNPHSGAVMAKAGMRLEGISRQSVMSMAGLGNAAHYAILRGDGREPGFCL